MKNKNAQELAKLSWKARKSPEEIERLRKIGKLGGRPRKQKTP